MFSKLFYSTRTRIVLSYLLIILLAFGLVTYLVSSLVGTKLVNERAGDQSAYTERLAQRMAPYLYDADTAGMYAVSRGHGDRRI